MRTRSPCRLPPPRAELVLGIDALANSFDGDQVDGLDLEGCVADDTIVREIRVQSFLGTASSLRGLLGRPRFRGVIAGKS